MRQKVLHLCTMLLASATRVRLYGAEHRLSRQAFDSVFELAEELIQTRGTLRIEIRGDELHCAEERFDAGTGSVYGLVRRLSDSGIGLIEFQAGLSPAELSEFCSQLADPNRGTVQSQPHVTLGTAELGVTAPAAPTESVRVLNPTAERNDPLTAEASHLVTSHDRLRQHHEIRTQDFRDVVLALMSRFTEQNNVFMSLAEVRNHNLFTYLHTCNVATLSIGFSLGLGVSSKDAFDLGVSALLHDIGKNFVPEEILDKPGRLTAEEWEIVKLHPEHGARMQLQQPNVNHQAVVVAYEHHMHYKRPGWIPELRSRAIQSLAARGYHRHVRCPLRQPLLPRPVRRRRGARDSQLRQRDCVQPGPSRTLRSIRQRQSRQPRRCRLVRRPARD